MDTEKIIYLARHAKSAWDSDAVTDFERPLSHRGVADVARIGETLDVMDWRPEKVISSPAIRAKQTCQVLCEKLGFTFDQVVWDSDIYAAYMVTLLQILSAQPESIKSILLIGHNPAMEDLLIHLCGNATSHRQSNGKLFTTGNVVKISLSTSWKGIVMCDASLEGILRPKML